MYNIILGYSVVHSSGRVVIVIALFFVTCMLCVILLCNMQDGPWSN